MSTPVLRVHGLMAPRRRKVRLRVDDTTFGAGLNAVVGPNGAGKTTLLRALSDASYRGDRDSVLYHLSAGESPAGRDPTISFLPQSPRLPRNLTVGELLVYVGHVRRAPRAQVDHLARELELHTLVERKPQTLSGGELARTNLAIALCGGPDLVLLDEPTAALDPPARLSFLALLRRVVTPRTIVIISSHSSSDVLSADRVHLVKAGLLFWTGAVGDFLSLSPQRDFDGAFVAAFAD